jgi:hypothetical protein
MKCTEADEVDGSLQAFSVSLPLHRGSLDNVTTYKRGLRRTEFFVVC